MARVKIGVHLQPQHSTIDEYRRAWHRADELGVDTIWNWDHFFPLQGDPGGPHWEAWTTLAVLGAETKRAHVGCLVLCMSYRNAALLSAMAKTLDHLIGGRLILGLGAGWFERDYQEYGYDFGTPGQRLRNLERGLEVIKERWQKDAPPPPRGTIPILIGGSGEKVTLRITAQHADAWNGGGAPEEYGRKSRILDDWCGKVGRDPAAVERTVTINPADVDRAQAWVDAGAQHVIARVLPPSYDFAHVERLLAWREGA